MVRKVMLLAAVLLLIMTGVASARPGAVNLAALQDSAAEDEAGTALPVETLLLGERYSNGLFDLEVQDAFAVDSPLYPGYDEVRLSVAFRHHTDVPWLPSAYAFTGEYGYPVLQLVDGAGEVHDIPTNVLPLRVDVVDEETDTTTTVQLGEFSYQVGGYALTRQPRGVPARWTVGFRVPSVSDFDLVVQASFGGLVVAEWDLESNAVRPTGWDRPEGFDFAELGDAIVWGDSLLVEPKAVTTAVCADPRFGHVTVDASVLLGVSSIVNEDTLWPAVEYPEMVAIAIWDDGTSARYSDGSAAFYDDDGDDVLFDRFLLSYGEHAVIPPQTDHDRFMEFMAPRDSRFSDVTGNPVALVLYPPDRPAVWVDLVTDPSGSINEFECAIPSFHLFSVDQKGTAPEPPPPTLEPATIFDA
jgi:hypothetical protein